MEKDDQTLDESIENEEDLLNFDLDDISPEDIEEAGSEPEEETIELVDLVEKGEDVNDAGDEEIAQLLEDDQPIEGESDEEVSSDEIVDVEEMLSEASLDQSEPDLGVSDISLESDILEEEESEFEEKTTEDEDITESDLEEMLGKEPDEGMELDLESSLESEGSIEDLIEDAGLEEPGTEMEAYLSQEEVSDVAVAQEEFPEPEEVYVEPGAEVLVGISEEKIEAILTRVVQDVVERVIRETMTEVAEKVITEAIDALKQSLKSDPD